MLMFKVPMASVHKHHVETSPGNHRCAICLPDDRAHDGSSSSCHLRPKGNYYDMHMAGTGLVTCWPGDSSHFSLVFLSYGEQL